MRYRGLNTTILLPLALLLGWATVQGANLSGTYTSTQTITNDSQLTGDVTCNITVPGPGPCIKFGAPNLHLKLNGHTITGNNATLNACSGVLGKDAAINTNGQDGAEIAGPGIITRFRDSGIKVTGSNSSVHHVVVTSTCQDRIQVRGSNNEIHSNSVSRFSLSGSAYSGISVLGSGGHYIHGNEVTGGGPPFGTGSPFAPFGYGIYVNSSGNVIEGNNSSGNSIGIWADIPGTGNTIHHNQLLGNVSVLGAGDIYDPNPPGTNIYQKNLCQTSAGPGGPVCPDDIPGELIGHR